MRRIATLVAITFCACSGLWAQQSRIAGPINSARKVALSGSVPAKANAAYDQGKVDSSQKMSGMRLLLKPSPTQQAALDQLLADQQNPASPRFYQWLTPAQFGERFGPAQADTSTIVSWLRGAGFSVDYVAQSRTWIAFSGTTGQVQSTFATEIHRYLVDGQMHFANATDPSIPAALAPLASAIEGLNDFNPSRRFALRQRSERGRPIRAWLEYTGLRPPIWE